MSEESPAEERPDPTDASSASGESASGKSGESGESVETAVLERPWDDLRAKIEAEDAPGLRDLVEALGPADTTWALAHLDEDEQEAVVALLPAADAADLLEGLSEAHAHELIDDLEPAAIAEIVEELESDHRADILGGFESMEVAAILDVMDDEAAADIRELLSYPPESAGGVMVTEFAAFGAELRVQDVLADLRARRDDYVDFTVQYLYVVDDNERLVGVLPIRDLLFARPFATLPEVMIASAISVRADASLEDLERFFDEHGFLGVPVVDANDRLVGVVRRDDVEEAVHKRVDKQMLGIQGIVEEEFRSMPLWLRSRRRLSWLSINIVLNLIAASVIAMFQDTLQAVIALAVFLPMISDMSGCSGNQAVAVSMRELSLGLIRPAEVMRALAGEVGIGLINGTVLGALVGILAVVWKGNAWLGLVVGGALAVNTLVAVLVGGSLPLFLKRFGLDPALVSGPLLTTITDMCGFLLALGMAAALMSRLL